MTALDTLCERCGIVDSFVDARGETRVTSNETRRDLLLAMGINAADEASAWRELEKITARSAAHRLPPVYVHYQSTGSLTLKVNGPTGPLRAWRVELEHGGVERGELQPAAEGIGPEANAASCYVRIDAQLPPGYHTLIIEPEERCSLIVTPGQCWLPDGVASGRKLWGVAAQVYLLRSIANWGIGDYGDLKRLVQVLATRGADVVGLSPLHAMFPDDPEQASPYSPASRLLLNILNIDVALLADSCLCETARRRLTSAAFWESILKCRSASAVDYSGVAALKLPLLRDLFECCDRQSENWQCFAGFRIDAGKSFEEHCVFLALRNQWAQESPGLADWHQWPEEYRRPQASATLRFAQEHAEDVTFQAWLQFIADQQLRACSDAGSDMAVGLYRDLAVGAAPGGAETWANAAAVVSTAHVGAPPDIYNPQGQDWGLPPFDPRALREEGYRSFIELVRANMRHAGGLRIDHVMALQQLYWVPANRSPADGAYIRYPLEDLVGILALESHRHRCLVVGEDLGTVPEGFRERMERACILSYRVIFFEKKDADFIEPESYPRLAVAVTGSHDLPTLRAWWQATDLGLKAQLNLYPSSELADQATQARLLDRQKMEALMRKQGYLMGPSNSVEQFVEASHSLLAGTQSAVTILQLDDLTGEVDPVNVPTTSGEHANWRRRYAVSLEDLTADSRFLSATAALEAARGAAPLNAATSRGRNQPSG